MNNQIKNKHIIYHIGQSVLKYIFPWASASNSDSETSGKYFFSTDTAGKQRI